MLMSRVLLGERAQMGKKASWRFGVRTVNI